MLGAVKLHRKLVRQQVENGEFETELRSRFQILPVDEEDSSEPPLNKVIMSLEATKKTLATFDLDDRYAIDRRVKENREGVGTAEDTDPCNKGGGQS